LHYEGVGDHVLLELLKAGTERGEPLSSMDADCVKNALTKAERVREIMDAQGAVEEKVGQLSEHIQIADPARLRADLERDAIDKDRIEAIEHQEEEDAELEEIEVRQMCAVELMTIVGSKGLSADHVIIIGFDNINMGWVTKNAFFVAMTRARKSLHIITSLRAGGATSAHDFLDYLPDEHLAFCKYTKGTRTSEPCGGRRRFVGYLRYLVQQGRRR
jgi:superfamily I DNA/RNA helicase